MSKKRRHLTKADLKLAIRIKQEGCGDPMSEWEQGIMNDEVILESRYKLEYGEVMSLNLEGQGEYMDNTGLYDLGFAEDRYIKTGLHDEEEWDSGPYKNDMF